jgi:hypothetical protein
MKSKKKIDFRKNTEWLYSEPVDLEHKQYLLLDFLKKCDKKIEKFELYPLYSEVSLQLANIHAINSEFKTLYHEKDFKSDDDEILLSELKFKPVPIEKENDFEEFNKILQFAGPKIFEYFNIVKSVSTLVYDAISVTIRKNDEKYRSERGYFYYVEDNNVYLWEYFIENNSVLKIDNKVIHKLVSKTISDGFIEKLDLLGDDYPIFEVATLTQFPLDSTLLPIFKKKILSHIIHKSSLLNQINSDVV